MSATQSLWMLLAAALFAAMGVCVKQAAAQMPLLELVFHRSFLGCLIVAAIARARAAPLRTRHLAAHTRRALFGLLSLLLFFYAIPRLPLSTSQALLQTSPLFLALLSWRLAGERPTRTAATALIACVIGMLFVLRPHGTGDLTRELAGGVAALAAGAAAGCAYYSVRRLGVLQEGGLRTVFYFTLLSTVVSGAALLVHPAPSPLTAAKLQWGAAIAVTATFGQLALTRALQNGKTLLSSSLMYTGILFTGLADYFLWRHTPDAAAWLGIALIIGGNLAMRRRDTQ